MLLESQLSHSRHSEQQSKLDKSLSFPAGNAIDGDCSSLGSSSICSSENSESNRRRIDTNDMANSVDAHLLSKICSYFSTRHRHQSVQTGKAGKEEIKRARWTKPNAISRRHTKFEVVVNCAQFFGFFEWSQLLFCVFFPVCSDYQFHLFIRRLNWMELDWIGAVPESI